MIHHDELSVTVVFGPTGFVEDFEVILLEQSKSGLDSQLDATRKLITAFFHDRLKSYLGSPSNHCDLKARELLRKISNLWTRARSIRSAFALLSQRYPLAATVQATKSRANEPHLHVAALIYAAKVRAEFAVSFELSGEEMTGVSSADAGVANCVQDVGVSVQVSYGSVE